MRKGIELRTGDYVLASKFSDGDTGDHFVVGWFVGTTWHKRFEVKDNDGNLFRHNGFRRCEQVSQRVGRVLVANLTLLEQSDHSIWHWRRNIKTLEQHSLTAP